MNSETDFEAEISEPLFNSCLSSNVHLPPSFVQQKSECDMSVHMQGIPLTTPMGYLNAPWTINTS
jgi:hypothetical protein